MASCINNDDNYSSASSSDDEEQRGFPFEFLDGTFECVICRMTIRELTELPCGHAGCRTCIDTWEKVNVSCSKCRKPYNKDLKRPSLYNDRMIVHEKLASCKQEENGCNWQGTIDDYITKHRRECLFKKGKCRRCLESVLRINSSDHNLVCPRRIVTCTECSKTYVYAFENEHKSTECPKPCDYRKYGCLLNVSGNGIEEHIPSMARSHLKLVEDFHEYQMQQKSQHISQLQQKLNSAEEQLKSYKDKFGASNTTVPQNQSSILPPPFRRSCAPSNLGGTKPRVASTPNSSLNAFTVQPSPTNVGPDSKFLKWDGKKYKKIEKTGQSFDDVWEMLKDKKFDDVSRIIKEQPNIVNSMRGKGVVTFIMNAAVLKRKDIVGYLSNQQYDLSIVDVVDAWNVLHYTVRFNKDDVAIEMLKSFDISQLNDDVINKRNDYKRTPLHYAAWKNNHKSIVWLMDQGADSSLKDIYGLRPDEHRDCSDETRNIIRSFKKW